MVEPGSTREGRFELSVSGTRARVSALLLAPDRARVLFVLGHGAGAGMDHPFLQAVAEGLAGAGVATLRYQFPYMEEGRRRPDPPHLLEATVRSAVAQARARRGDLPLIAGGKSMGGRMTSQAQAKQALNGVLGLVFLGFPLHPRGRPGDRRAEHLADVSVPMLFLQGTRDQLAGLDLLEPVCRRLGERAQLHVIQGADHSFGVRKRSGRTHEQVLAELIGTIAAWSEALINDPT